jgi:hypothetical protein
MGCLSEGLALVLILIVAVSCLAPLIAKPANAQSIPTPSVPQFTAKFALVPNNITTIDASGQSTTKQVQNETLQIIIKNQLIAIADSLTTFNYNVRYKGHSQENWTEVFIESTGKEFLYPQNTSSQNTLISLYLSENQIEAQEYHFVYFQGNGQIDFQVEAIIATFHPFAPHGDTGTWTYITSGWSPTQTATIPASSTSTSPTPTPTSSPAVPELSWLAILPFLLSAFSFAVIIRHRKTNHTAH